MLIDIELAAFLLIAAVIAWREGFLSPNSIYVLILFCNAIPLYFLESARSMRGLFDEFIIRQAITKRDLAIWVLFAATFPAIVSHLVSHKWGRRKGPLRIERQSVLKPQTLGKINSLLVPAAAFLFILTFAHLLDFGVDTYLQYTGYLSFFNETKYSAFSNWYIRSTLLVALASAMLFGHAAVRKNVLLMMISFAPLILNQLILISHSTRASAFPACILLFNVLQFRVRFWRILTPILFSVAVILFCSALHMRGRQSLGLYPWMSELPRIVVEVPETTITAVMNVFCGGLILSAALALNSEYPISYKLLSFSPFPSFLDSFDKIRGYQWRISSYVPYNALAEAYWFGLPFLLLFFFILLSGLLLLRKTWVTSAVEYRMYILAPAWIAFMLMHQYPLRNFQRFFYLSLMLSLLSMWYLLHQNSKSQLLAQGLKFQKRHSKWTA